MKDFFKVLIVVLLVLTSIGTLFTSLVFESQVIEDLYDYDFIVDSLSGIAFRSNMFLGAVLAFEVSDVIIFEFDPNQSFYLFYYFETVDGTLYCSLAYSYTTYYPENPYIFDIYRTSNFDFFKVFLGDYFNVIVDPDLSTMGMIMEYNAFVIDYPDDPSEILIAIVTFFNDILGLFQQGWHILVFGVRAVFISIRATISLSLLPLEFLFTLMKFAFPLP